MQSPERRSSLSAFAGSFASISQASAVTSRSGQSSFVCRRVAPKAESRRARHAVRRDVRMEYNPSEDRPSVGFTYFAETLNGRAAMIGFMIAIGYEYLRPEDGGLVAVLLEMMGK